MFVFSIFMILLGLVIGNISIANYHNPKKDKVDSAQSVFNWAIVTIAHIVILYTQF